MLLGMIPRAACKDFGPKLVRTSTTESTDDSWSFAGRYEHRLSVLEAIPFAHMKRNIFHELFFQALLLLSTMSA